MADCVGEDRVRLRHPMAEMRYAIGATAWAKDRTGAVIAWPAPTRTTARAAVRRAGMFMKAVIAPKRTRTYAPCGGAMCAEFGSRGQVTARKRTETCRSGR
jgi:hypothetical protein